MCSLPYLTITSFALVNGMLSFLNILKNNYLIQKILKNEMRKILAEAIEELSEREKLVVSLYYYENLNLSDIAKILEISVQRVSQINAKAITKLKSKMNSYIIN